MINKEVQRRVIIPIVNIPAEMHKQLVSTSGGTEQT